jgi:hypothetical protein
MSHYIQYHNGDKEGFKYLFSDERLTRSPASTAAIAGSPETERHE